MEVLLIIEKFFTDFVLLKQILNPILVLELDWFSLFLFIKFHRFFRRICHSMKA